MDISNFIGTPEMDAIITQSETRDPMDLSFIGDIVQTLPGLVYAFDKEGQQNQLAIAQANASAANARNRNNQNGTPRWVMPVLLLALLAGILYFIFRKKPTS